MSSGGNMSSGRNILGCWGEIIGLCVLVLCLIDPIAGLFVSDERGSRHLATMNFNEAEVIEKQWLFVGYRGCSIGDDAKFITRAVRDDGRVVYPIICCGWLFKGCTERTPVWDHSAEYSTFVSTAIIYDGMGYPMEVNDDGSKQFDLDHYYGELTADEYSPIDWSQHPELTQIITDPADDNVLLLGPDSQ